MTDRFKLPAFFTTLRSNLQLSAAGALSPSLPPSAISTPTTSAFTHPAGLQYPNPSSLSISTSAFPVPSSAETAAVPPPQEETSPLNHKVAPASPPEDRIEALKLIADSVGQQRQLATQSLVLHPATLATTVVILAIMARYLEWTAMLTTAAGLIMASLLGVRWYTSGYLAEAERINFKWLDEQSPANNGNGTSNNRDPIVVVSKWGDEVIGALVMRVVKRERKGYVSAWTVKSTYRNKGIGRGLLEEAAKIVWGKGGRGVVFADGHANSKKVLPDVFNQAFEKNEVKSRQMLAEVVAETRRERSSR